MALIFANRVLETSTTTGTGTYTLAGAVTGFQTFAAVGNSNTCYYYAEEVDGSGVPSGGWEVGIGTYTTSGTTLARTAILASSNSNNAVSWSAGTRRIAVTASAVQFNPPCVRATRASTQSTSNGAIAYIALDVADTYDTDAMHDPSTNNTRITFTTAGVYALTGEITYTGNSAGERYALIDANGASTRVATSTSIPGVNTFNLQVSTQQKFAAGEYVELGAFQTSGGSLDVTAACMTAVRVAIG